MGSDSAFVMRVCALGQTAERLKRFQRSRDGRKTEECALVPPVSFVLAEFPGSSQNSSHQREGCSDLQRKHSNTLALDFPVVESSVVIEKL